MSRANPETPSDDPPFGPRAEDAAIPLDLAALARDWATLWQSELAALATDREMQEAWQAMVALWAEAWASTAAALLRPAAGAADERFRPSGAAGAAAAAGAAPAAAASDAGDAAVGELRRRIAELEQRLARHERAAASRRPARGRPGGRPGGKPGGRS
jgi:hypothetical protein